MRLFGTDGIRAKAGEFPLDSETVHIIGASWLSISPKTHVDGHRELSWGATRVSPARRLSKT